MKLRLPAPVTQFLWGLSAQRQGGARRVTRFSRLAQAGIHASALFFRIRNLPEIHGFPGGGIGQRKAHHFF